MPNFKQLGKSVLNNANDAKDKAADIIKDGGTFVAGKANDAKDKAADIIKDGGDFVADKVARAKEDYDLRKFKPITEEQLLRYKDDMPAMIQVTDWDKRQEEDVCKDAVAFYDGDRGFRAITLLTKNAGMLDATFYPSLQEGFYYKDPCDPNYFINLNDYFDFLKKARVHELNQIAQDLGAKHIKITLKSEKKVYAQKNEKDNHPNFLFQVLVPPFLKEVFRLKAV